MAPPKLHPYNPVKPGFWLGFFFWVAIACGAIVILVEYPWMAPADAGVDDNRLFQLDGAKWLAFFGGLTALLGALTTARISLRNSIKQHTLNVLLDMRLSETYMGRVTKVNARYHTPRGIYYVTDEECKTRPPEACLAELTYLLNYFEFIASAIRYGDLDENLLRQSLRGIICTNFEIAHGLIIYSRKNAESGENPRLFEHLEWLYRRWFEERLKRKWLARG